MLDRTARDVEYTHDGTRMVGALRAPARTTAAPTVVLVHDAFGLSPEMLDIADRLVELGLTVFAADVWGERTQPASEHEIGPLIGGMVGDRPRWHARVAAAHAAAAAQPEVDPAAVVTLGYCFGGSSALEHARTGGDVRGVIAVHPGLDLLEDDWSAVAGPLRTLVCVGSADPMATAAQRTTLQDALTGAGADWEVDLYGGAKHAFSSVKTRHVPPNDVIGYDPRAAARSWEATTRFLHDLFPDVVPATTP